MTNTGDPINLKAISDSVLSKLVPFKNIYRYEQSLTIHQFKAVNL